MNWFSKKNKSDVETKLKLQIDELNRDLAFRKKETEDLEECYANLAKDNSCLRRDLEGLGVKNKALEKELELVQKLLRDTDKRKSNLPISPKETPKEKVKRLTKSARDEVRKALNNAPRNAQFSGHVVTYDRKTKRVVLKEITSVREATDLLDQADKGELDFVF